MKKAKTKANAKYCKENKFGINVTRILQHFFQTLLFNLSCLSCAFIQYCPSTQAEIGSVSFDQKSALSKENVVHIL